MSKRNELIAISEFLNISMLEASQVYNTLSIDEVDYMVEWYLNKKEQ